jgi:hypothetical protein
MSFTTNNTGSIGIGLSNAAQSYTTYPQTEQRNPDGTHFQVETVENGYILRYAMEGYRFKTYICKTPQELSDQILASMVINKMEK